MQKCNKKFYFRPGCKVIFYPEGGNYSAEPGAMAIVDLPVYGKDLNGIKKYLNVKWINNELTHGQYDGGYLITDFTPVNKNCKKCKNKFICVVN